MAQQSPENHDRCGEHRPVSAAERWAAMTQAERNTYLEHNGCPPVGAMPKFPGPQAERRASAGRAPGCGLRHEA